MEEVGMIYKKMALVLRDIGSVGRNQTNKFHKYKYRGIDDVYNVVHQALAKHGVFIMPQVLSREEVLHKTVDDKGVERTTVRNIERVKYVFFAEDGSFVWAIMDGEGSDKGDKSVNKALTSAMKNVLIKSFCIPTEDCSIDSEEESPSFDSQNIPSVKKQYEAPKLTNYSVIPTKNGSKGRELISIRTGEKKIFPSGTMWVDIPRDFLKTALRKSKNESYKYAIQEAIKVRERKALEAEASSMSLDELEYKLKRAIVPEKKEFWSSIIDKRLADLEGVMGG